MYKIKPGPKYYNFWGDRSSYPRRTTTLPPPHHEPLFYHAPHGLYALPTDTITTINILLHYCIKRALLPPNNKVTDAMIDC